MGELPEVELARAYLAISERVAEGAVEEEDLPAYFAAADAWDAAWSAACDEDRDEEFGAHSTGHTAARLVVAYADRLERLEAVAVAARREAEDDGPDYCGAAFPPLLGCDCPGCSRNAALAALDPPWLDAAPEETP